MENQFVSIDKKSDLIKAAFHAKAVSGKALYSQLFDMFRLWSMSGRLSPSEYYELKLYDDRRFSWDDKKAYMGYRAQSLLDKINHPQWHGLANDKLLFHSLMMSAGVRVPEVYAVYHSSGRVFCNAQCFSSKTELAGFIREGLTFPCFGKPVQGVYGRGAVSIKCLDATQDSLVLSDGSRVGVGDFLDKLHNPNGLGYMFQELARPSEDCIQFFGDRLSSVRVWVLVGEAGPKIFYCAEWKIPTGDNMVDNFGDGSLGNLLAQIDIETGHVQGVYGKNQRLVDKHPDTQEPLSGCKIPRWDEVKGLVLSASQLMPKLRFQGWDIALTDQGPMPLEVNVATANALYDAQLKHGKGIIDESLMRLIEVA